MLIQPPECSVAPLDNDSDTPSLSVFLESLEFLLCEALTLVLSVGCQRYLNVEDVKGVVLHS